HLLSGRPCPVGSGAIQLGRVLINAQIAAACAYVAGTLFYDYTYYGGVFTEERYEVWPPNMGFLPSRLCRAAGDDNPRPAIDSKGVSGWSFWVGDPSRIPRCSGQRSRVGRFRGTPKDVDTI